MKRLSMVLCLIGLGSVPTAALAETPPSVWDCARDPAVGERYRLHLRMQELLEPPDGTPHGIRILLAERARAELEEASAATSPDVRLRFDLGKAYYDLDRLQAAIDVLRPALAMAPRDGSAVDAWERLAFAAARLDRSQDEIDAEDAYLALAATFRGSSLTMLGNRAEAEMRLGHLDAAIAGYRDVLERGSHLYGVNYAILVLARWGLAVALDRNGYSAEAEHEALEAAERDPVEQIIGDREGVFFVPDYDRDWYFALGRTQHAKHTEDPHRAYELWKRVAETWADYVRRATPDDRWLRLAKRHLAAAQMEEKAAFERLPASERAAAATRPPNPLPRPARPPGLRPMRPTH
jgi:tetratricopeptide (TPR) repeat protein